jgi:crotonobetainyl-CoA:carnitine CoA-transferase CaiB-like acyl-CoA transferase
MLMTIPGGPLAGLQIVDLSLNLPGPLASARLRDFGATVIKVEPPGGDPLETAAPWWYEKLRQGKQRVRIDLKDPAGQVQLHHLLDEAALLLTSSRPRALARLGLAWEVLHARYPYLCQVAIVGHRSPHADLPGHDLTYQIDAGLLEAPTDRDAPLLLPRTLIADIGGAEQAASTAIALLLGRERDGEARYAEVVLADAAHDFAAPLRHGLTIPGGRLGGGYPPYNLYATADGHIGIVALEPAFWARFTAAVERPDLADPHAAGVGEATAALFRSRPTTFWLALAQQHDVPIVAFGKGT